MVTFKLPIFHKDIVDVKEHLFILEKDWEIQNIFAYATKILDFIATLTYETLQWVMKYNKSVPNQAIQTC